MVSENYKESQFDRDYKPTIKNKDTDKEDTFPYEKLEEVFYNALPKKEYKRIFMCKTAKDVWNSLIITHQVLEKDSKASKNKKEKYKSLPLKAKKVSSDEEVLCSGSDDEEYVIAVRDFKKFFRRRGKFIRQPHDDKKNFRRAREEKKGKERQRCFKCGDLCHFISDCPKHSFNDQKEFVGGCWSDSEEEDDSKKDEICLMAHDLNEFENSRHFLQEMIENQRSQKDKKGLGFTEDRASTSEAKMGKLGQEN
ncbi:zf-CCHC domain-containing protein [Tanacetum coccineum]